MNPEFSFNQHWPKPSKALPIVVIGAGGIVVDSHLPAYRNAGYDVRGIWNRNRGRAEAVAKRFSIPRVYDSLEEVGAERGVIFDIATSPQVHLDMLNAVPDGAPVLIQKPMGLDLAVASDILATCRRKQLTAAVNFQLRFAPMMLAIRDALKQGFFGDLIEIEVHLNLVTPWHLFPNLIGNPRVEIVAHSVHYIDLIQSLVGVPGGAFARSFSFPGSQLTDTRTTAILDYGPSLRCTLSINHHHDFGRSHQDSTIRIEGTNGAAIVKLGVLLDYPRGEPDELWMGSRGGELSRIPLEGHWFPDSFELVMHNLQRYVFGEDARLETSVDSAWSTMAIVEACYESARQHFEPVQQLPLR
ncbi:Gfo/Idh/MocA family oxidoreductase [Shinella sp. 838]|uniref:Gfo/Idh/MocA family protein n=1 Tax=Shinella sp. 838 TaxID=3038164 RepID=UPI0024156814|nr:Gfo/Idh/MocA family oxidoreductase [Shinella sp. 838]MDG4674909.1 Gfo/Idh/MocA family oxidoreductase [Shinella sp. 838]